MLSALLYDLDGTLANTDPFHYRAWKELLAEYGLDIDEPFYRRRISGRLNPAIVRDLLPELSPEAGTAFADRKEARFRELARLELQPLAGLIKIIEWAEAHKLQQAVVTNAPPENVRFILEVLQLQNRFDRVIIAEDIGIGKPDPAPYQFALDDFEIQATQAIAFEDSPSGIRSAVGANIVTIGIASTQDPAILSEFGASFVIQDFTDQPLWDWLNASC